MYSKEQAIKIVIKSAEAYKKNLSGKNLLFICMDKAKKIFCIETVFTESRFLHLTGFKVDKEKISATDFFERCIDHRLSVNDFEFAKDGTTELKLDVLPFVVTANLGNANMAGDFNGRNIRLFTEKIVGTVKAGIGFVRQGKSDMLVPNTMIKADIREYLKGSLRIIATYTKNISDEMYSELVYQAKGIALSDIVLPEGFGDRVILEKPICNSNMASNTVRLIPMTRELCHELYRSWENDDSIYMDMSLFKPYTYREDAVDRYYDSKQDSSRVLFAIMLGDRPIGEVQLKQIDQGKKECILSIHMQNDKVKGKGYGTEAERLAIKYAFEELGMLAVTADTVVKNVRSQHILDKLGFKLIKEEGDFRYYQLRR